MLTITDVPPAILDAYKASKIPAARIVGVMGSGHRSQTIDAQTDICAVFPESMIFVRSGVFKYFCNDRFIRFYSTGDILHTPSATVPVAVKITTEFGSEVSVVKKPDFLGLCLANESLLELWHEYQISHDYIMHVLCSLYVQQGFEPRSEIRQYNAGDVVIQEGDGPDYLFEMLEGTASVTVGGTEIGVVREGEVFGEVSFLTGTRRGATVTCTSSCLIQAINRPDLEKFAQYRPGLIFRLSKTLAFRLNEVNKKLVSISSLT